MMKNVFLFSLGLGSLLLVGACESATHVDIDATIEEKVTQRLHNFRDIIAERCRERADEEAGLLADSIIMERARKAKLDSLMRPDRPLRPGQPELKTLEDSLPLAPLFDTTMVLPASKTFN